MRSGVECAPANEVAGAGAPRLLGAKSTTRRIVPPRHGGGTGLRTPAGAASSLPALEAGEQSVTHRTVEPVSGNAPGLTCGAGSSMTMVERPSGVWPVTTRRTGFGMCQADTARV